MNQSRLVGVAKGKAVGYPKAYSTALYVGGFHAALLRAAKWITGQCAKENTPD